MCVYNICEVEILKEDLIAYKIVNSTSENLVFISRYSPHDRNKQDSFDTTGKYKLYTIGKNTESSLDSTPGLYCYCSKKDALKKILKIEILIEVLIPKGTKIRRASSNELNHTLALDPDLFNVILAEKVITTKVLKESRTHLSDDEE